jgi:hypothetical protein
LTSTPSLNSLRLLVHNLLRCDLVNRVYILNKGSHDYSEAESYGELVFVSDGMLSKFATGVMFRLCQDAFHDSEPTDYILISSLATLCSVACAVFAAMHGRVNLLIYHPDEHNYIERVIKLN